MYYETLLLLSKPVITINYIEFRLFIISAIQWRKILLCRTIRSPGHGLGRHATALAIIWAAGIGKHDVPSLKRATAMYTHRQAYIHIIPFGYFDKVGKSSTE